MAKFGTARLGIDRFGHWSQPKRSGKFRRLLPMLSSFLLGRRDIWNRQTFAGLFTGNFVKPYTFAGKVEAIPTWTLFTFAGTISYDKWKHKSFAGTISGNAKRKYTFPGYVQALAAYTFAGLTTMATGGWIRFAGQFSYNKITALSFAGFVQALKAFTFAGTFSYDKITAETFAGEVQGEFTYYTTFAGNMTLEEPAWQRNMAGR